MERDFMGLRTKVKQEVPEEITDSASGQNSKMQWTFSNKESATHQFLSFHSSKNEMPKTGFQSLASNGLVSITTTESADTTHYPFSNIIQNQGGNHHFTGTTFPQKPLDSHSFHRLAEERKLHLATPTNQTVSLAMSCHVSTIPYLTGSTNMQLLPGKNTSNPVVGTTELRNVSRISGAPTQLTIFYGGSVCVYEDISHEKAQAIMLLAGNESSINSNPAAITRPSTVNQNHVVIPCFSNAVSVTSISSCDDAAAVRTIKNLKSPSHSSKSDMPKAVNSTGSILPPTVISSGSDVPLFRKASLARFLEKRKERVLSVSPYSNESKQSKECSSNKGPSNKSMPGSCALPAAS